MKNIIYFSLAISLLYACGNSTQNNTKTEATETAKSVEFTINAIGNTMTDMAFDTKEIKVKAGTKIKINLTNQGSDGAMQHNIVFVKQGSEKEVAMEGIPLKDRNYFNSTNPNVLAGSAIVGPGMTAVLEFTASEAGNYSYICTYPGHWMKMQGVLIVE